jgi:hypothetical protein
MRSRPNSGASWLNPNNWVPLCLISFLLVSGCNRAAKGPVVEFTRVPPGGEGGPDRLDDIEGVVRDAPPGERIVVYAKAGTVWWIQPLATHPFTSIASGDSWKTSTHLGSEYAALLVDPGYEPPLTLKALPPTGNGVSAVVSKTVGAEPAIATQTVKFSGYEWYVRHITSDRNGGISHYDPANAWTDADGALHLRITRDGDLWKCAQVTLANHFGYGTYLFSVRDTAHLQPAAALAMFTYDDLATEHHREMDIEMSRWGDPKSRNGDYVVQPYMFPENKVIFNVPGGSLTHSLRWEPGKATFTTSRGATTGANLLTVEKNVFTTGIPTPGGEAAVIDFCDFKYSKVPLQSQAEIVIERFQYLP